jgi:hypothetical protein
MTCCPLRLPHSSSLHWPSVSLCWRLRFWPRAKPRAIAPASHHATVWMVRDPEYWATSLSGIKNESLPPWSSPRRFVVVHASVYAYLVVSLSSWYCIFTV